jgi:hypothetical protein
MPTVAVCLASVVMYAMLMTPMVLSVAEAATVATAEVTPMAKEVLEPILGVVDMETAAAAAATAVAAAVASAVAAAVATEPAPEPGEVVTASVRTMTTVLTIKMTTQMAPRQDEEVQVGEGEGVGFRMNRTNHHRRRSLKQPSRRLPHRKSVWFLLEAKPSRQHGSRGRYSRSACKPSNLPLRSPV